MARILITGSADGLGRAAAETLLEDGHEVIVHARSTHRRFHQRLRTPQQAVRDLRFQDDLLDALARFTGVPLT
jgi:NAD(P)-dependent dehydrogenase (short-subunit alcohol dehydrogenase family)